MNFDFESWPRNRITTKAIAISELVCKFSDHVFQTKIQTHHLTIDKILEIWSDPENPGDKFTNLKSDY